MTNHTGRIYPETLQPGDTFKTPRAVLFIVEQFVSKNNCFIVQVRPGLYSVEPKIEVPEAELKARAKARYKTNKPSHRE